MTTFIAGLIALGVPLLLIGLLFLRRNKPVLGFYVVALLIGLGYLTSTGAVDEIGAMALEKFGQATAEKDPGPTPAPAPAN
jgi:hypothetical protein